MEITADFADWRGFTDLRGFSPKRTAHPLGESHVVRRRLIIRVIRVIRGFYSRFSAESSDIPIVLVRGGASRGFESLPSNVEACASVRTVVQRRIPAHSAKYSQPALPPDPASG